MKHLILALLALVTACHPDPKDTGATPQPPADLTQALGPEEARAGQLTEQDVGAFIGGTAGESGPGDWLLYNDRARFVVRGAHMGHGYVGEPGVLVDLDVVRPQGQADRDGLDELLTMAGFGLLAVADSFELVNDGQDGQAAEVRWTGTDQAIPYVEGMLEAPGMFAPKGLAITQIYRLEPGSPALEVTTEITNTTSDDLTLSVLDAGMTDVCSHASFASGAGFDGTPDVDALPMVAMVSRMNDQAWAIFAPDKDLDEGLSSLGASLDMVIAQGDSLAIPEGETGSWTRLLAVARDLDTLERYRRELRGLPLATASGRVLDTLGSPVAGARVFLTDGEGEPLALAITDGDGAWTLGHDPVEGYLVAVGDGNNEVMDLPAGPGAYGVHAHASTNERALAPTDPSPLADGYGRSDPVAVSLVDGGDTSQDITLQAPAILRITTKDYDGSPVPSVIHLRYPEGLSDPQPPDARLGEERPRGTARRVAWVRDGEMDLLVPPGTWDLVAHHGFRYELTWERGVVATAGQVTEVELDLTPAWTLDGWVAADFHAHGAPSIDGEVTVEERLLSALGNGLQVHFSTDHDHAADYRPAALALGLDPWMITVPGSEISTNLRGHFNGYPVEPDPALPNGGSPRWWEMQVSTEELLLSWRDFVGDDGVLQVNHGRDGGLFDHAGWDPVTGTAEDPDKWSTAFDVMEILNRGDVDFAYALREDFCSLLDQGEVRTAMGVSDSHGALPGSGCARTWVRLDADPMTPDAVPDLVEAVKGGHAVVSGGPMVVLEATDGTSVAGPGDTLPAPSATLHIQVLAPSWMPVTDVRLYGSGCRVLQSWVVDPASVTAPTWFDGEVEVDSTQSPYFFVEVEGWTDMDPVWTGGRPYAMTNPVWLE